MRFTNKYSDRNKDGLLRAELCARSGYTQYKGIGSPTSLVKRAQELNISALALCDFYSTAGYEEFSYTCRNANIDAIYGATIIVDFQRCIVLAKNKKGVTAINTLITRALSDTKGQMVFNTLLDLAEFSNDIITIGLCSDYLTNINLLYRTFDYIGLTPTCKYDPEQVKDCKNRCIAISDSCYLNKSDKFLYDLFDKYRSDEPLHLRDVGELLRKFPNEIVFDNPLSLVSNIEDDAYNPNDNKFSFPNLVNVKQFKAMLTNEINKKPIFKRPEYVSRLEKELSGVIASNSYNFFYIAYKLAKHLKEKGYYVTCKGLTSASLLSYALGISNIDPIKWNIPYYSYLGFDGRKMPTFNLVIPEDAEKETFEYLKDLVGKENVIRGGINQKFSFGSAAKKVAEFLENNDDYYEGLENVKIFKLCETVEEFKVNKEKYFLKDTNSNFCDYTPVRVIDGEPVSICDDISLLGHLFSIDVSPNQELTLLERLEKATGIKVDTIPLNDPLVLQMYITDRVIGNGKQLASYHNAFECIADLGSNAAWDLLKKIKPRTVEDYLKVFGFLHGSKVWEDNAEELLERGYSLQQVISNREDIYDLLTLDYKMSEKDAYSIMENVRKGRGLKSYQKELLEKHGLPKQLMESMERIKYAFPRSASLYFANLALKEAYYKVHFTKEFYKVYFEMKYSKELLQKVINMTLDEKLSLYTDKNAPKDLIKLLHNLDELQDRGYELILNGENIEIINKQ